MAVKSLSEAHKVYVGRCSRINAPHMGFKAWKASPKSLKARQQFGDEVAPVAMDTNPILAALAAAGIDVSALVPQSAPIAVVEDDDEPQRLRTRKGFSVTMGRTYTNGKGESRAVISVLVPSDAQAETAAAIASVLA